MQYLIGIDLGTQGTKTALYDETGIQISEAFIASKLEQPQIGIAFEDADKRLQDVLDTLHEVIDKSGVDFHNIAAIGIDGQMAGIMGIDEQWNALTPYDSWLDTKCEKYISILKKNENEIIEMTGSPVTYAHAPKMLWWKNERTDVYRKISKFIMMTTYIVGKLTGLTAKEAYLDETQMHFSGFIDARKGTWREDAIQEYNLDIHKMPAICSPWKRIGRLQKSFAVQVGLPEGIPIAAGCGDQAATAFGAGVIHHGEAIDVSGTASLFACCVNTFCPDVKNKTMVYARALLPETWIPQAYVNGGGLSIRWLHDVLKGTSDLSYEDLEKMAEEVKPGSDSLLFVPHFQGRVCPNDPFVRGSFLGLNWSHTQGHLFRAAMESIGYEYSMYIEILSSLLPNLKIHRIISTGGGSKNKLFNQIKADILGVPLLRPRRFDAPTLGAAVLGGCAGGIFTNPEDTITRMLSYEKEVIPRKDVAEQYLVLKDLYQSTFATLRNFYRELCK